MQTTISTFYKFTTVSDPASLRQETLDICRQNDIRGTILIADEGINASISGSREAVESVLSWLRSDQRFADLVDKKSHSNEQPFKRLKVKIKSEIVTFGQPDIDPVNNVGIYVEPEDWNSLIEAPDAVVIDTRNTYEFEIGTFEHAINPNTQNFSEFASYVSKNLDPKIHSKVVMFCTGGIRCEKATAYMRSKGFKNVYHLKGGVLKYLETVSRAESKWHGACFVFDNRVSVTHGLQQGNHVLCQVCGRPVEVVPMSGKCNCLTCGAEFIQEKT